MFLHVSVLYDVCMLFVFLCLECYIILYKICVVCLCCLILDLYIILDYLMLSV